MKETAEESAELMMALKHDPWTPELHAEAHSFPVEADEAISNVERGHDSCTPQSWVALVSYPSLVKDELDRALRAKDTIRQRDLARAFPDAFDSWMNDLEEGTR